MKYSVIIKCNKNDYTYVINKIIQNKISVLDSSFKKDECFFVIYEDEYELLKLSDYKKCIIFAGYKGLYNIINLIRFNLLYIIVTFIIILIIFVSNRLVIKVNIYTNNINLNQKIKYYLMDYKINDYSFKKSYKTINVIKNNLLNKYSNEIEWIEIVPNGYEYNVYIIERKKNKNIKNDEKCHYVAKKSGTITRIKVSKGVLLVQENNYINQGDILISGDIIYNEEIKKEVCAVGKIYGEVWYEVDISYPLKKEYTYKNKRRFYNLVFNVLNKKYPLFKNKYSYYKINKKIGSKNIGLSIISSSKVHKKFKRISERQAIEKSIEKVRNSIMLKSHNNSKILSQNILKKYVKNDTIYLKVLVTLEEELGVVERY